MEPLKVLLVEQPGMWQDILKKALDDVQTSLKKIGCPTQIHLVDTANAGWTSITGGKWDLIVTDIGLGEGQQHPGTQLVEEAKTCNVPCIVVTGVAGAEEGWTFATQYGVKRCFDKGSFKSTNFIQAVVQILHERCNGVVNPVDFLIITPMREEFEAFSRLGKMDLKKVDDYQHRGGVKCDNGTNYNIVISCLHLLKREIGQSHAAAATTGWVGQWQPSNLLLVGTAAGAKGKVQLGDILIPATIVDVTSTKIVANGENFTPQMGYPDKELFNKCNPPNWKELIATISRPEKESKIDLHTGGCIISTKSKMQVEDWTTFYKDMCEKLHGLEMEASGVMTALDRIVGKPKPKFMMIRAVSDFGGTNRKAEQEKWEKYACDVAAAYTYAFLKSGPVPALNETQSELTRAD
ncbi:MAG: hypothetical protein BWK78_06145 [Thiotrichaceae bacterium IS1]|nr:MAG: hypothetical protein BWK78_06145 [Thiotrichaceae bacterium IS1]